MIVDNQSTIIPPPNISKEKPINNSLSAHFFFSVPWSTKPFRSDDPRLQYALDLDPRIHFALNCGAESCPPISVYSVDNADLLNKQLETAAQCFVGYSKKFSVDSSKRKSCRVHNCLSVIIVGKFHKLASFACMLAITQLPSIKFNYLCNRSALKCRS